MHETEIRTPKTNGTLPPEAENEDKVLESIQSRLDDLTEKDDYSDVAGEPEDEAQDGADAAQVPGDETDGTEDTEQSEDLEASEPDTEPATEQAIEGPVLPQSVRQSLRDYGWSDSDIDTNLRHLGDKFIDTANRLHATRVSEIEMMMQAGQRAREQEAQQEPASPNALTPVDVDALKKEFGDDALVDALAGPVNRAIEAVNAILPRIERGSDALTNAQADAMAKRVDAFFAEHKDTFAELYGDPEKGVSDKQREARINLLTRAYDVIAGAQFMRGQNIPLEQALEYAHGIVSRDFQPIAARKEIASTIKKRNKGIMQKPTSRGTRSGGDGSPKTDREIEANIARQLKSLGIG